jgi:hypothetical protein
MEFLQLFFILLFGHWLGDFVFQSHWMAQNKSKNNFALFIHTYAYSTTLLFAFVLGCLTLGIGLDNIFYASIAFFLITFVTHGVTDYFTSRVTSKLWAAQRTHTFFVMIGFDQLVHFYTIILTMLWSLGGFY